MLDRLVESNDHRGETKRRGGFLLSTLMVVVAIFASGILWSLFAKDLTMNAGDFDLSTIVAPVPMPDDEPPPPPAPKIERAAVQTADVTSRQTNMERVDEARIVPKGVSVVQNTQRARPLGDFLTRGGIETDAGAPSGAFNRSDNVGSGLSNDTGKSSEREETANVPPPPPPVKKETPKPPTELKKSLGVINGIAVNLVKPNYTAAAKAIRAEGAVNVQVTIDERGNIVAANAVSGHPLLRQVAEQAALASKFKPTLLSNQPVKATGIIVYKFALQ